MAKNSSSLFRHGPEGSIDDLDVKSPCVARIGNEYIMFYEALGSKHLGNPHLRAKSQDGIK